MDSTYLIGLVVLAMIIFFFRSSSDTVEFEEESTANSNESAETELSSVERYLSASADAEDTVTGVEKYLSQQVPVVHVKASSVEQYLESKAKSPVSRVSKYISRQAIAAKQAALTAEVASGVDKYLKSNQRPALPVKSGVAKYLDSQVKVEKSSVSKYLVRQAVAAKNAPAIVIPTKSGVAKYLETRPVSITTGVSRYMSQQVTVAKQVEEAEVIVEEVVAISEPATGVEKYLRNHQA